MAIELNLVKSDDESWGFRVTGGAECGVPLTVVKVTEESIAEKGGLQCNDIIVKVNDVSTADLTHSETHDLIVSAKNNLALTVERFLLQLNSFAQCDEETNAEVCTIMQSSLELEEQLEQEQEQFEIIDPLDGHCDTEGSLAVEPERNATTEKNENNLSEKQRKWSTFLQKPSNPKPVIKKKDETPMGEPYRVVITKQKKKESIDLDTANITDSQGNEREGSSEKCGEVPQDSVEQEAEADVTICPEAEEVEEITTAEQNIPAEGTSLHPSSRVISFSEKEIKESCAQREKNSAIEKVLEEKLAEVQKQLEALSKLPSTIQLTIDAVTKQIATIVSAAGAPTEEGEDKAISETSSENDVAEQVVTEESYASSNEVEPQEQQQCDERTEEGEVEDDTVDPQPAEEENNNERDDDVDNQPKEELEDPHPDEGLTEEEKEAMRIEREMKEKQQKEQLEEFKQRRLKQKPTLPLKPIERPIILPGGRRWSQPDDACPSVRNPKMSDEKIANTIETYSEVILGKTKGSTTGTRFGPGPTKKSLFTVLLFSENPIVVWSQKRQILRKSNINFLKYQPPPKNLDYLQRSDVYKMVHDLEPPVRGISSRASKILSEQDYYQAG